MDTSIADHADPSHRVIPERRRAMASADLRIPENVDYKAAIGRCIERSYHSLGWNLDQFATAVGRDPRQVRRWIDGSENAQFAALFAIETLRGPLLIQLATLSHDIAIQTVITLRRTA